ncbi:DNA-processing protein DprA [Patescibacteria group bacterium]
MSDREYLAAVYSFNYFGPARTKLLVSFFGSAKKVWSLRKESLVEVGISIKKTQKFIDYRNEFDINNYFNRLKKLNINFYTYKDKDYPRNLSGLSDEPLILYYKGKIKKRDKNAVAIVGSRKITSYGRDVATKFASELATYGATIVSGLAFGVDVAAHKACLEAGGRAIAVLASGLDTITPVSNSWLGKEIIKKGGAIVSEYPLGHKPQKSDFPERNRIISGLSKAVLVIEGAKKSGTLHTASHAAEQGRQVFAVPGQVTSPMSQAPHYLIKNGAKMATSTEDVLEELDMQLKVDHEEVEKIMPEGKDEAKILSVLEKEPLHTDEIIRLSDLNINIVSSKLTMMEIKGVVKNLGSGMYKKT